MPKSQPEYRNGQYNTRGCFHVYFSSLKFAVTADVKQYQVIPTSLVWPVSFGREKPAGVNPADLASANLQTLNPPLLLSRRAA